LRSAEFGFLGVIVFTWTQTPRFWGEPFVHFVVPCRALKVQRKAGALVFRAGFDRGRRTSWLMVGNSSLPYFFITSSSKSARILSPAEGHD
jgi:hypothetical protein